MAPRQLLVGPGAPLRSSQPGGFTGGTTAGYRSGLCPIQDQGPPGDSPCHPPIQDQGPPGDSPCHPPMLPSPWRATGPDSAPSRTKVHPGTPPVTPPSRTKVHPGLPLSPPHAAVTVACYRSGLCPIQDQGPPGDSPCHPPIQDQGPPGDSPCNPPIQEPRSTRGLPPVTPTSRTKVHPGDSPCNPPIQDQGDVLCSAGPGPTGARPSEASGPREARPNDCLLFGKGKGPLMVLWFLTAVLSPKGSESGPKVHSPTRVPRHLRGAGSNRAVWKYVGRSVEPRVELSPHRGAEPIRVQVELSPHLDAETIRVQVELSPHLDAETIRVQVELSPAVVLNRSEFRWSCPPPGC
ncbi:unnamed protein product [Gadus morhua 'NCC']